MWVCDLVYFGGIVFTWLVSSVGFACIGLGFLGFDFRLYGGTCVVCGFSYGFSVGITVLDCYLLLCFGLVCGLVCDVSLLSLLCWYIVYDYFVV